MRYKEIQKIQLWRNFGLLLLFTIILSLKGYGQSENPQLANFYQGKVSTEKIKKTTVKKLKTIETITGTVTDGQSGETLPGVNILVKGTTTGASTDQNGQYDLTVPSLQDTLVFTYIGYQNQEVPISGRTQIDVALQPQAITGEEMVVVGYGTQEKSQVNNAVSQIDGADIEQTPAVSLSNSLAGRMPGLYIRQTSAVPGHDDPQISVRGFNTYRNNAALVVIDGVASSDPAGLNRLDPNDIKSISVLKDASAAIYGAQSSGGVILVTTKRGSKGKPDFEYNGSFGFQTPTARPKTADALEYMHILNSQRRLDETDIDFEDELISKYQNGELTSTDWWDALIDPPIPQTRHSVSVNGGTDAITYYTSVGMVSQQGGILRGDDKTQLNQYNLRSNLDFDISKRLTGSVNLSLRQKYDETPQNGPGGTVNRAVTTSPLINAYVNGDPRYPTAGFAQLNPAAQLTSNGYQRTTNDVVDAQFRADYDIPGINGLSIDGFASIVKFSSRSKNFFYSYHFYDENEDGEIVRIQSRPFPQEGLREGYGENRRITLNTKLRYKTTIEKNHNVDAFVAYEQMTYKSSNFGAARNGYDTDQIDYLFAGTENRDKWGTSGSASQAARMNVFGRLNYDYKNKYLATFNFRYDGSHIFPKDSRWGFFPGISAGWLISEEPFAPNLFSNLKLRASWGETGNDRVGPYQYLSSYGYSRGIVFGGENIRGLSATSTPNPNITWEVATKTDIGLEAGFLQDRLNVELDVFKESTKNILGTRQASIPEYTGLSLPDENIGKMENKGIEFQASYRQYVSDNLSLNVGGNISYNKNKILYIDEPPRAEPYQKLEGHAFGSILVYKATGIFRNEEDFENNVTYPSAELGSLIFADLNGDGEIDNNDRYRFDANPFPKFQGGFYIGGDYKGFDFNMLFQGQAGGKWRLNNRFSATGEGNGLGYVANHSYTQENTSSELPRINARGRGGANSDFWYHDSNWIRLKSATLGYSLPQDVLSKVGLSGARFYLTGRNLFLVYNSLKKYGMGDPEFTNSAIGDQYPNMRTFRLGINLKF